MADPTAVGRRGAPARGRGALRRRWIALLTVFTTIGALAVVAPSAGASPLPAAFVSTLDLQPGTLVSTDLVGNSAGVAVGTAPIAGLPTNGGSYLVMSTGDASQTVGDPATFVSTALGSGGGADGNDMTQVRLQLRPPAGATCFGFDFSFLSEEYPEYVGSNYNDVFTAELNHSEFSLNGTTVVAPNNFAYDSASNAVSINTVFGMTPATGTTLDGATPPLSAITPVELGDDFTTMTVILSIQDLGDSIYDSVALIDNTRWLYGVDCKSGSSTLTDSDGDSLPDVWETSGIDYDGDGQPELDLPAMGADPQVRDLFAEVDWMVKPPTCVLYIVCWGGKSFAPDAAALNDVVAAYANAPGGPIRLHIDSGPNSTMDPVTGETWGWRSRAGQVSHVDLLGAPGTGGYDWTAYEAIRNSNFDVTRADAFHYVVYGDRYHGSNGTNSSGISRGIPGGQLLVTDGAFNNGAGFTRTQERGTFMHEFGHNLNLYHGGGPTGTHQNDPVYRSVMNYAYQLVGLPPAAGLDYSRGAPYDDWANLRFDGGSIGDLGQSEPDPETTTDDSLTEDVAKSLGSLAVPGDGAVNFLGPETLISGTGIRQLLFDVTNPSTTDATYTVEVSGDTPFAGAHATVAVPAGQTGRATADVDTAGLLPGTLSLTATLSSDIGGSDLSSVSGQVLVPDLSGPDAAEDVSEALAQLSALGDPAGLDPEVKDSLVGQLEAFEAPNSVPVVSDTAAQTPAGQPVSVTFSASDADGDALTFSVATQPANGTVSGSGPTYTYTPASGFSGTDSFTVTVSDGKDSVTATATVTVTPPPAQSWTAKLKLRGSVWAEGSYAVDAPTVTRLGKRYRFNLSEHPGGKMLRVTGIGLGHNLFVGTTKLRLPNGKFLQASLVFSYSADSNVIRGVWASGLRSGGTLEMKLQPPS